MHKHIMTAAALAWALAGNITPAGAQQAGDKVRNLVLYATRFANAANFHVAVNHVRGFTAWGVELARKANLTLVGRARGKRFVVLAGAERIVFDQDLAFVEEESSKHRRKAAMHDE